MLNQKECLQLIELYKNRENLWNPKHKNYFNRKKREDAWKDISSELKFTMGTLKGKMKALMGSYRSERSKEKKSRESGAGTDEMYISKWFAYQHFDFLRSRGTQNPTLDTASTRDQETSETDAEETILPESPSSQLSLKFNEPSSISQAPKRIRISDFNEEMESLQKETVNKNNNRPDDQYDTFARHISAQLRELPVRSFVILQGQIQDLITRERLAQLVPEQEIQQYDNRPSTSHSHCSDLSIQVKEEILNKTDDENDEI